MHIEKENEVDYTLETVKPEKFVHMLQGRQINIFKFTQIVVYR